MNHGNFTRGVEHRLTCFKRLVGEGIQVFIFHSIGPFDPSSIDEVILLFYGT